MISVTAVAPRPLWHDIYNIPGIKDDLQEQ